MRSFLNHLLLPLFLLLSMVELAWPQEADFNRKLDALKAADNLSEWLYERMDHDSDSPQRLHFLMATQKVVWRKARNPEEHTAWLNYLNNLGYEQLMAGKILDAINSYEQAFSWYEQHTQALKDYDIIEYTLKPLSNNYTRLGDYERALYLQQKSISILKASQKYTALASIYSNMAISYRSMGNFKLAESSIKTGLSLAGADVESITLLNNILADVLDDQNRLTEAGLLIRQNINRQKNSSKQNPYLLMGAYTTAGSVYLKTGQSLMAGQSFNLALKILDQHFKNGRLRERANIYTQLGKIKLLDRQPKLALSFFSRSLRTLGIQDGNEAINPKKLFGDNKLMEVFEQMAEANLQVQEPEKAFQNLSLSLLVADKIRREFADDQTKERLQASTKTITEKAIEICYQAYSKTHNSVELNRILNLAEQSKSRTLLDQIRRNQQFIALNRKDVLFQKKRKLEQTLVLQERAAIESGTANPQTDEIKYELALLNKQIRIKYPQFSTDFDHLNPSVSLKNLPKHKILEFFFGQQSVYLLVINRQKIERVIKIDDAEKLRTKIVDFSNRYFQQGPSAMLNAPGDFQQASYHLYRTLLGQIQLNQNETLTIIPDEVLGYISFDGLLTDPQHRPNVAQWPFLIRQHRIIYAFSLMSMLPNTSQSQQAHFTGLFITHLDEKNRALRAVQREENSIKKLIRGRFLLNEEANIRSFTKAFDESQVLHIGTHAYLSGPSQEPTLDFGKDKIFLFELAARKQAPALVVLSACRTADGLLARGEGIISLSRGFSAIGTPATIAGLWNVNDDAAAQISAGIYKYMLQGQSGAAALHQAKLDWLNSAQNSDAYYFPYYWDSFIYMGTDQVLKLEPAINWTFVWSISALFVVLLLLFFYRIRNRMQAKSFPSAKHLE